MGAQTRIIYDTAWGALWFDADGAGEEDAVLLALLSQGLNLSGADFLVS